MPLFRNGKKILNSLGSMKNPHMIKAMPSKENNAGLTTITECKLLYRAIVMKQHGTGTYTKGCID